MLKAIPQFSAQLHDLLKPMVMAARANDDGEDEEAVDQAEAEVIERAASDCLQHGRGGPRVHQLPILLPSPPNVIPMWGPWPQWHDDVKESDFATIAQYVSAFGDRVDACERLKTPITPYMATILMLEELSKELPVQVGPQGQEGDGPVFSRGGFAH
ncbi:hypothetical protein IFM51744_06102 [Aspergillus udagawae]|nr:hypothetical protein IFM51744_06102 [Aspergillus udagawae]